MKENLKEVISFYEDITNTSIKEIKRALYIYEKLSFAKYKSLSVFLQTYMLSWEKDIANIDIINFLYSEVLWNAKIKLGEKLSDCIEIVGSKEHTRLKVKKRDMLQKLLTNEDSYRVEDLKTLLALQKYEL